MRAAWRRTRADLWPLAVTVLVVALTVGVTDAVPRLLTDRADTAVRTAVAHADPAVDVVVTSMYGPGVSDPTAGARGDQGERGRCGTRDRRASCRPRCNLSSGRPSPTPPAPT